MGMNETVTVETSENKTVEKLDRNIILEWLKQDVAYLRDKGYADNPGKNTTRIQYLRASIYGCSVMLQALKDKEIDDLAHDVELIKEKLRLKNE